MTSIGFLQIAAYFLIILALTKPVGVFMAKLFGGERTFLHPILRPIERLIYKSSAALMKPPNNAAGRSTPASLLAPPPPPSGSAS